jgi:hypothetical protein
MAIVSDVFLHNMIYIVENKGKRSFATSFYFDIITIKL